MLHIAVWNGISSLSVVEARIFGPLKMLFVDVSIRIADGRLEVEVGNSKRLKDVQNLWSDLEIEIFDCFEDIL